MTFDAARADRRALERNVARFQRRHPELARAVLEADPEAAVVVQGSGGQRTVSQDGSLLASAYDPAAEGRQVAEQVIGEPVDLLVAIGFGLGHQLEAFREQNPCPLLVYEPCPARLRAALCARPDLTLLESDDVVITHDLAGLRDAIDERYVPGLRMRVLPHPALLRLAPDAVGEAVRSVSRTKDTIDLRGKTQTLMMTHWVRGTVENAPRLLETPSASPLYGSLAGVPAVICAAGPSLTQQLPLLAHERERLFVIAIGQSYRALRRAGIEPDLVHVSESKDVAHQLSEAGDLSRTTLVIPPHVHPSLFDLPVETRLISHQASNPFGCWIASQLGETALVGTGGTVAQSAVHLAAAMGAGPILLIGQDLAFTDGRVYARDSAYEEVSYERNEDGSWAYTHMHRKCSLLGHGPDDRMQRDIVWVEGWNGEPVPTDVAYASFRETYRDIAAALARSGTQVWNCTEGGARIPGMEHLSFAQALGRCPTARVNVRERLLEAGRQAPADPEQLREPIRKAQRTLDRLEREADRAVLQARRFHAELAEARNQDRIVHMLRKLGRDERRLRRDVGALPFLSALVQPELMAMGVRSRRSENQTPTPKLAIEESALLFETTLRSIQRSRALIARLEELLLPEPEGS